MSDEVRESIENALTEALRENGDMVTKWVLAAEVIDENGERGMWSVAPIGQKVWDSFGLLEYAAQIEHAEILAQRLENR